MHSSGVTVDQMKDSFQPLALSEIQIGVAVIADGRRRPSVSCLMIHIHKRNPANLSRLCTWVSKRNVCIYTLRKQTCSTHVLQFDVPQTSFYVALSLETILTWHFPSCVLPAMFRHQTSHPNPIHTLASMLMSWQFVHTARHLTETPSTHRIHSVCKK